MWIVGCEIDETGIAYGQIAKKCDQPAIIKLGGWSLCFDHHNLLAKIKLKKRKDGSIVIPKGF